MAQLFSDGFESGSLSAWASVVGSPSVSSSQMHHGSYSLYCPGTTAGYVIKTLNSSNDVFFRFYIRLNGSFNDFICLASLSCSDQGEIIVGVFNNQLFLRNMTNFLFYWGPSVVVDQWCCLEVERKPGSGNAVAKLWVNGVLSVNETALTFSGNTDTAKIGEISISSNLSAYFDCVVISDAYVGPEISGSLQTVTDAIQGSDVLIRHKTVLPVIDVCELEDEKFINKTLILADYFYSEDSISETFKTAILVSDGVTVFDLVFVDKNLIVSESVDVSEMVESGLQVRKKTRLFLVLGDLAIQLNSD